MGINMPFIDLLQFLIFLKLFITKLVLGLHLAHNLQVVFFAAFRLPLHLLHLFLLLHPLFLDICNVLPLGRQQGIVTLNSSSQKCVRALLAASKRSAIDAVWHNWLWSSGRFLLQAPPPAGKASPPLIIELLMGSPDHNLVRVFFALNTTTTAATQAIVIFVPFFSLKEFFRAASFSSWLVLETSLSIQSVAALERLTAIIFFCRTLSCLTICYMPEHLSLRENQNNDTTLASQGALEFVTVIIESRSVRTC